uniref:Uncharacterized protein n=1 Tax=Anopheles culicifacies TaxID=139723 RepID=A0A182M900_9DIPT
MKRVQLVFRQKPSSGTPVEGSDGNADDGDDGVNGADGEMVSRNPYRTPRLTSTMSNGCVVTLRFQFVLCATGSRTVRCWKWFGGSSGRCLYYLRVLIGWFIVFLLLRPGLLLGG